MIFVATPWLWPWTFGPSVSVLPWLITLVCMAGLLSTRRCLGMPQPVAAAWVFAALGNAVIGVLQFTGTAEALAPFANASDAANVFGNLRQRNQFASLMNIGLASLVATVWVSGLKNAESAGIAESTEFTSPIRKTLVLGAGVLLVAGNVLSMSRTGLAQLVMLCMLLLWWYRSRSSLILVTSLLALYATLSVLIAWGDKPAILDRLTTDLGCSSRKVLWSNVVELIAQKPLFGWGWGELDYAHYAHLYDGERFCAILDNAHNLPLHLAVELGVPFALLVCAVVFWTVFRAKPWRETVPTRQLAWGVLGFIGLHSLLEYPLWYGPFVMTVGLCVLMLLPENATGQLVSSAMALVRASVGVVFFAVAGYLGWDYHRVSQLYLEPEERAAYYREGTLSEASTSRLFRSQVEFAELTLTPLTRQNASAQNAMALRLLHYSPEPRIIEKVIESATLLGRANEALWHLQRYRSAFPQDHATWASAVFNPGAIASPAR